MTIEFLVDKLVNMAKRPAHQLFYIGQKALIEKDGAVLVLHSLKKGLDLPGGRVQTGETDFTAALQREVKEETNLEITVGEPYMTWSTWYTITKRGVLTPLFLIAYHCHYQSGDIQLSREHDSCDWITKATYHSFKNDTRTYIVLEKYFQSINI